MSGIQQFRVRDVIFHTAKEETERIFMGGDSDVINLGDTQLARYPGYISSVVPVATDGTTTINVEVNGRKVFDYTSVQPSVNGKEYTVDARYPYKRGDTIKVSVISGTTTGSASIGMTTTELLKRDDIVATPARGRLTRATERASYDPLPHRKHQLQERWGSFAEAAARQTERTTSFTSGGGVIDRGGGAYGTSAGGKANQGGPTSGRPGGGGKPDNPYNTGWATRKY